MSTIFEFDGQTTKLLDELTGSSQSRTRVQTLRKALYLLKLVCDARADNKSVFILDGETGAETEIVLK